MLPLLARGSFFLGAGAFRTAARGVPSSAKLKSCVHSRGGACALPIWAEKPAAVIAKKADEISSKTRIGASSRDSSRPGTDNPRVPKIKVCNVGNEWSGALTVGRVQMWAQRAATLQLPTI
jgi:hypothetical protein